MHVAMLYCAVFTFGVSTYLPGQLLHEADIQYDGAYLNGLLIVPSWGRYFGNPAGQDLGLITASFYFRRSILF